MLCSPTCFLAGGGTFFGGGDFNDLKVVEDAIFFWWGVAEVCHCVSRDTVYVNLDTAVCPF